MKNKKVIIVVAIVLLILLLIPIPIQVKDGSMEYKAILYKLTKIHKASDTSPTNYEDGWDIQILGFRVYYKLDDHGVDKVNDSNEQKKKNVYENPVTIYIKNDTLTPKGATFILKNNTDENYCYEPAYYIEKKEGNKWNEIVLKEPLSWNSVIYTIKPREETEINIDWSVTGYGALKNGEYRLVKRNFRKENSLDSRAFSSYVEFEIE